MFTNEEVRTAMTGLVEQKGEGHTSYGKYKDPLSGKGACFLGALCEFMGLAIPAEGTTAGQVLGAGAVSVEMASAFAVAQCLNDAHFEWKYVLLGVDLTLKVAPITEPCPCGCGVSKDFTPILDEVRRQRSLDKSKEPMNPGLSAYVTGGIISGSIMPTYATSASSLTSSFTALSVALTDFTTTFNAASAFFPEYSYAGTKTAVKKIVAQKDHALVA
jgi:hypothetical protein